MSRINHVPFEPGHLLLMDLRDHEKKILGDNPATKVYGLHEGCAATTMLCEGRVVCVLGYLELWPGVWDIWIFPSVYMKDYALPISREIRRIMDNRLQNSQVHRIQSACLADPLHDRWMEFLGFQCEGVLQQYGADKQDFKMWAYINGR